MHAQQRLADRTEGLGEIELGHHHALEQVRCLADHHCVDVGKLEARVGKGTVDGFPAQPGHRDIRPLGTVVGLSGPDHGGTLLAHQSCPSITHTRFCCSAGPDVAGPSTLPASEL